jgi:hypothetical protein
VFDSENKNFKFKKMEFEVKMNKYRNFMALVISGIKNVSFEKNILPDH